MYIYVYIQSYHSAISTAIISIPLTFKVIIIKINDDSILSYTFDSIYFISIR